MPKPVMIGINNVTKPCHSTSNNTNKYCHFTMLKHANNYIYCRLENTARMVAPPWSKEERDHFDLAETR